MAACVLHRTPYAERFRTIHPDGSVRSLLGVGQPLEDEAKHGRFGGWNFDVDSTVELAGEWISRHPDFAAVEHGCSIEPAPASGNLAPEQIEAEALLERAKSILRIRQSRERLLGRAMIGEPAFDLLMCLYVRSDERDTSLTTLANTAAVPYSSAIRWITYLSDKGLVARTVSDRDRRVICVGLTTRGRAIVDEFLSVR
jgi:DNA-binding MarR family transcriptional regulator